MLKSFWKYWLCFEHSLWKTWMLLKFFWTSGNLNVGHYKWKKTIIFCKDATKTCNPYANIIILLNEFVVGLPSWLWLLQNCWQRFKSWKTITAIDNFYLCVVVARKSFFSEVIARQSLKAKRWQNQNRFGNVKAITETYFYIFGSP